MELQAIVPELLVEDMARSIDFYTRALDFQVSVRMPGADPPVWAQLANGSAALMLLTKEFVKTQMPNLPPAIAAGGAIILLPLRSPEAARDAYAILQKQASVVLPLREVGNGAVEFAIADPEGNMIVVLGQ